MKKKQILQIAPVQTTKTGVIARTADIKGESHLLMDFYDEGEWWLRCAYVKENYSRYIVNEEKWTRMSRWQLYIEGHDNFGSVIGKQRFLDKASQTAAKKWSKKKNVGEIIRDLEDSIDAQIFKNANDRKLEEMKKLFDTVPELPEHYVRYIKGLDSRSNIIYYERRGRVSNYKCAQCGHEWSDRNIIPRKGNMYECPDCMERGRLEWKNRSRMMHISNFYTVFQKTTDGKFMSRTYWTRQERSPYMSMDRKVVEIARVFFVNKQRKEYNSSLYYGMQEREWRSGFNGFKQYVFTSKSLNEPRSIIQNTDLKYMPAKLFDLTAAGRELTTGGVLDTIKTYVKCPQIEILYKMGLTGVCRELIIAEGSSCLIDKRKTRPEDVLKINKQDLKYILKSEPGEVFRLRICQWMKKFGIKFTDENVHAVEQFAERYAYRHAQSEENLKIITQYTTVVKAYNYIEKQRGEASFQSVKTEYIDYLCERAGLGYDMTNTVYLFPKDLHGTYASIRLEAEARKNKESDRRLMQQFTQVEKRFKALSKKYTYEDEVFIVRPAKNVLEIIEEGRYLHHCVGSENQRYMRNHNDGKAFILMLRKVSEPDIPYATIEIDGTRIRQWHQANDKKPDKDIIDPWLDGYIVKLENKTA